MVGEPPFNISENPLVRNFYQTRTQVNLLYFDGQFKINGILSCVVSNALGRASADLLIEPKGTWVWPCVSVGVCLGVSIVGV